MVYRLSAEATYFFYNVKPVTLTYVPRHISAVTAAYVVAGPAVSFKRTYVMKAGVGSFLLKNQYVILYYPEQVTLLRDELAEDAPAVADFFVPLMYYARPAIVLDVDHALGQNSNYQHRVIVQNFYSLTTRVWDDLSYHNQFAGQTIPSYIKVAVADQERLHDQYLIDEAAWLAEYNKEKILQWPYYWAGQLLARR
jgi:hypothetical protein